MHVPEDKTKRKTEFAGIPIDVQFDKGDRRHYPAANGYPEYNVIMQAVYGEVPQTKGTDGDPVDVYIGPDAQSSKVFVLRQMKFPKYESFDEEKCMLGFSSAEQAKTCYLKHHQNKKIFGGMKEISMEDFKKRLETKGRAGKKLAAANDLVFALQSSGVKMSSAQVEAVYKNRASRGVLGMQPETAEPPPLTSFGEATADAAKVAYLKKLVKQIASATAHPVAQNALTAPSPEDGLLEIAKPAIAKTVEKAKALVKKSESRDYGELLRRLEARRTGQDQAEHRARKAKLAAGTARVDRIADRVDDVGIGMLAAPYLAKGVAGALENRGGRLGAIGHVARGAAEAMHRHETGLELGGLALVAPGITHRVARGIDRVVPQRSLPAPKMAALEKFAAELRPDFEYMTEPEKRAYLGALRSIAARAQPLLRQGVQVAQQGLQQGKQLVQQGVQRVAATPMAQNAAPAAGRLLTPTNVAKGTLLGAGALGAVGAYKGVKGFANFLGGEHRHPVAPPAYDAPRVL